MSTQHTYSIQDLARQMGRNLRDVERLASRGVIPGRKIDGSWLFQANEIRDWIQSDFATYTPDELQALETSQCSTELDQDFPVSSLLKVETIEVPLQARTKRAVLERLVQLAGNTWQIWSPDEVLRAVIEREEAASTAFDGGIALPHPKNPMPDAIGESVIALGIAANGIPFGGGRSLTDLFFLILSRDNQTHLQILARLGRLFHCAGFLDQLRASETPEEAWQLIADTEKTLL